MPTFDTPAPISIALDLSAAQIWIDAGERANTGVEVTPSNPEKHGDANAAEQTRVEYANGHLTVKMPKVGWRQWTPWGGDESIDLHIGVPSGSHLQGSAAVGTLHVTGRLGACSYKAGAGTIQVDEAGPLKLRTGAGDITITRALGDTEISTGSGGLRISRVEGGAVARNSNGDTWIGEVTGDARVNAANGRIGVDRAHTGLTAKTANGDIRLGEVRRGHILAETACGKVDIGVLDGVAAWLDLNTHFGSVRSELDPSDRPRPGDEAVQVRARSSMGDITVRRAARDDMEVKDA